MSRACNAAAVGMFDGVHRGHLDIMNTVSREARASGGHPVICTFADHPVSLLRPADAPKLLTTPDEKAGLIKAHLPDAEVCMLHFREMRGIAARDFLRRRRVCHGVGTMVMGYANRFGCDGPREREAYDAIGRELGLRVVHVPPLDIAGATASSTRLRSLISAGKMAEAAQMLGRPYSLSGTVVRGRQLGRTIGFPTANLTTDAMKLLPATGVYAGRAIVGESDTWPAIVNIGHRPTVEANADAPISIEAHLAGCSADLYDRRLTIEFDRRLRDEQTFPSLEALRRQLQTDLSQIL